MKLGMFMMPYHDPTRDLHRALLEDVETAVHADAVGFDEIWVGEHYSAPSEPITSPLWVWIGFREYPGILVLAGGALVLAALVGHALLDLREGRRFRAER